MPIAPKHPCNWTNCAELVNKGQSYCPKHQAEYEQRKAEHKKILDKKYDTFYRNAESSKIYASMRWRKLRNWWIKRHPLCEECLKRGLIQSAEVVDHIQPLRDGGAAWSAQNLQSLCNSCHRVKTIAENKEREHNDCR